MCIGSTQWWEELSNSGDTLKIIVPSSSWKTISGWTNHSEMVTSYNIKETEMGYRGSKSANLKAAVKEQRADGSWFLLIQRNLRCALTGFERGYPIKYLSKQINNRLFTSIKASALTQSVNLNPWFITGFADAESCFTILIQPSIKNRLKWRVKPIFTIGLHSKDVKLLNLIKNTLGVGKVNIRATSQTVIYSVESFKDLEIIINHFKIYPLVTAKINDFILFNECFEMIKNGEHLTEKGLLKIISLKSSLNLGLPENLKQAFPSIPRHNRKEFEFRGIPSPFWIAGFTSGDGSFNLKIGKSSTTSIGVRIQLRFGIGLHIRELKVIKGIAAYLNLLILYPDRVLDSGAASLKVNERYKYIDIRTNAVTFQITKFSDIINIIIPFFERYSILGQKALDFSDFKEVSLIMKNNAHLTEEGFKKILEIKKRMNKKRSE
jgi:hypothetical protein